MAEYSYLYNLEAIKYINSITERTQYVKINVLDQEDNPLRAIEGYATQGSISLNGSSAVRRTGSLTMIVEEPTYDENFSLLDIMYEVTNIESLISINKRIELEIGIKNPKFDSRYDEWDVFWFPLGIYLISNPSVTYSKSGIQISLKLNDKMALLNGEAGGVFPANITHSPAQFSYIDETGALKEKDTLPSIKTLVKIFVQDYGDIPQEKSIIDIPKTIEGNAYWGGESPLYINYTEKKYSLEKQEEEGWFEIKTGGFVGYSTKDFTYPKGELSSKADSNITSALETVKNTLGNYEYFFDLEGFFRFQEIKNYLNTGSGQENLTNAINEKYFSPTSSGKSVYKITDAKIVTNYNNSPQYNKIKNDFVVLGKDPLTKLPIKLHIMIREKPFVVLGEKWYVKFEAQKKNGVKEALSKDEYDKRTEEEKKEYQELTVSDWRLKLYLMEVSNRKNSVFSKELLIEFPRIYDFEQSKYFDLNSISYWFDFIDPREVVKSVSSCSIEKIGLRTKVLENEEVNCLFLPDHNYEVYGKNIDNFEEIGVEKEGDIKDNLLVSMKYYPASDLIRATLHEYLGYANTISISTLPIYNLDVNQLITVENNESDIHGNYLINSISLPLTLDGVMSIKATKAIERF